MKTNLTLFEKICLTFRYFIDAKKVPKQDGKLVVDIDTIVSPFITMELEYFLAERDGLLGRNICLVNLQTESFLKRYRFMCFPKAMARIDEQISLTEHRIKQSREKYEVEARYLQKEQDAYGKCQALHHAQIKVMQEEELHKKYVDDMFKLYGQCKILLNEKIRIINALNAKINLCRTWRYLRISYYYSHLCGCLNRHVYLYTWTDFKKFCGEPLETDHTKLATAANQKIEGILKQMEEAVWNRYGEHIVSAEQANDIGYEQTYNMDGTTLTKEALDQSDEIIQEQDALIDNVMAGETEPACSTGQLKAEFITGEKRWED